jgi:hypothetical protein
MIGNVVNLADYRAAVNNGRPRRPPRPPGNERARDFELIAMVSVIPYAARDQLSEWDRNYIYALSTRRWYRGQWARLTPNQRKHCWRIIAAVATAQPEGGAAVGR